MDEDEFDYRGVYIDTNHGWFHLIRPLIDRVLELDGEVVQVKEKFGKSIVSRILTNVTEDGEYVYDDIQVNPTEYSDKEFEELKGYMREFMADVEEEYNV